MLIGQSKFLLREFYIILSYINLLKKFLKVVILTYIINIILVQLGKLMTQGRQAYDRDRKRNITFN